MRPANAETIAGSIFSKPCSRKSAPRAASRSAARTLRFRTSRVSSSSGNACAPRSCSRRPSSSSRPTTAQLWRETTWERIFARRPSEKSGCRAYSAPATASSRTLSPRNSRRSYESVRSGAHDACVNTRSARFFGRASIRPTSARGSLCPLRLLVRGDVIDRLADRRDLLCILVGDLDPELVLELHDQLDQIERVCVEVLLKRRLLGDLAVVDSELLGEDFLHSLEDFLTRRCHVTSLSGVQGRRARRCYTVGQAFA